MMRSGQCPHRSFCQLKEQQCYQAAGQGQNDIVGVQGAEVEQFPRGRKENDTGEDGGRGRDHPPQSRVGSRESGKNGCAQ